MDEGIRGRAAARIQTRRSFVSSCVYALVFHCPQSFTVISVWTASVSGALSYALPIASCLSSTNQALRSCLPPFSSRLRIHMGIRSRTSNARPRSGVCVCLIPCHAFLFTLLSVLRPSRCVSGLYLHRNPRRFPHISMSTSPAIFLTFAILTTHMKTSTYTYARTSPVFGCIRHPHLTRRSCTPFSTLYYLPIFWLLSCLCTPVPLSLLS